MGNAHNDIYQTLQHMRKTTVMIQDPVSTVNNPKYATTVLMTTVTSKQMKTNVKNDLYKEAVKNLEELQ